MSSTNYTFAFICTASFLSSLIRILKTNFNQNFTWQKISSYKLDVEEWGQEHNIIKYQTHNCEYVRRDVGS